jgi:hypothetical protein
LGTLLPSGDFRFVDLCQNRDNPAMLLSRRLDRGAITYSAAKEDETNILQKLTYVYLAAQFRRHLNDHRSQIEALVSGHLGLSRGQTCRIDGSEEWMNGSFNVCIPVYVDRWKKFPGKRLLIRFPLPYKAGEPYRAGNADEKLRCEAATFCIFFVTLTDIHQSNIFVDKNWHITYLIDMEWACTRPIEMQHPPHVDLINYAEYTAMHKEFMEAFEEEEMKLSSACHNGIDNVADPLLRTSIMQRGWDSGNL